MAEGRELESGTVRTGLHFTAALRALELAASGLPRRAVAALLAPHIAATDEGRRRRIAATLARRFPADEPATVELHRLVRAAGTSLDTRHLLLYAVARQEPLVLAIASTVFYERFVLRRLPAGMSEREYCAVNTGKLLETDEVVTHRLVHHVANRLWGPVDAASTQCALRILREGGALGATWIARDNTRCLAYFPTHRGPSWRVFTYALWEQMASRSRRAVPRAHLRSMVLARLFALPGPVVDLLADRAAAAGFGVIDHERSGGRFLVTHRDFTGAMTDLARTWQQEEHEPES